MKTPKEPLVNSKRTGSDKFPMNIKQALANGFEKLSFNVCAAENSDSPELDTQVLLCHTLDCNTAKLIAWPDLELSKKQQQKFESLISQRQHGTSIAYLTGHREFWSLDLKVTPATLIPRPDTELLVETILDRFSHHKKLKLADLGTGSGAIAIALASEHKNWEITATDISNEALDVARFNAKKHQLNNIKFFQGTWFEPLADNRFDIIISNPPYIASEDQHLETGDVRFEPDTALASGPTGMDDIEHLCQHAHQHLNTGGLLLFEHGYDQQKDTLNCLQKNKFSDIMQLKDLAGHVRVSLGIVT